MSYSMKMLWLVSIVGILYAEPSNKILFAVDIFPWFTHTSFIHELVGAKKAGFEVIIYANQQKLCSYIDPLIVQYNLMDNVCVGTLPNNLSSYKAIFCKSGLLAGKFIDLKKRLGIDIPIITYMSGDDLSCDVIKKDQLGRDFFVDNSLLICDSLYVKHQLEVRGCNPSKIVVLPAPIDEQRFKFRLRLFNSKEKLCFISVGPLNECRSYADVIRVLRERVLKNYPNLKIDYKIVGDGPGKSDIIKAIADYKMEQYVAIIDWCSVDEIADLLHNSHIFLLPLCTTYDGVQEGVPAYLKEAMAVGTVVITTRHGGIHEIIENDLTGLLVPEHDISYLGNCIISLIRHPEKWPFIQLNARKFVVDKYNIASFESVFFNLLSSLV